MLFTVLWETNNSAGDFVQYIVTAELLDQNSMINQVKSCFKIEKNNPYQGRSDRGGVGGGV